MNNQLTTKPKHFLDTVEESIGDTTIDNNSQEFKNELTVDELEKLEEERLALENEEDNQETDNEDDDDNNNEPLLDTDNNLESLNQNEEFTFSPFVQELVDSDLLEMPEGKDYDDDINGFKELIDDNVRLKIEDYKANVLKNPISVKFFEFLENGGNPDEFIERSSEIPDYANADLEDETTLKNLIADHLHIQGYDKEDIDSLIGEYEEIGSLAKHATTAQKYLVKYAEKEIDNLVKEQNLNEERRIQALQQEAEVLKDAIYKSSDIGGFKLTKTERDKLYDYIMKPVKTENGKIYTQNTLEDSTEIKLALALYKMKKFNFKDIENKVETKKVNELQTQLKRRQDSLISKNNTLQQESNTGSKISGFDWLNK